MSDTLFTLNSKLNFNPIYNNIYISCKKIKKESIIEKIKYITKIHKVEGLSDSEKEALQEVSKKYKFRSNDYYLSLIDWNDPNDPIRNIIIPKEDELLDTRYTELDASAEHLYTVAKGLEHKYKDTALILYNDVCGGYCRFCFRKRLFIDDNDDVVNDLTEALKYIKEHKEIQNVLITGGDPLVAPGSKLIKLLDELAKIEHLDFIRIGTKMLAFNPRVFLNDTLLEGLERINKIKKIKIMGHFNHPNEITSTTKEVVDKLKSLGLNIYNQTPLVKNVNDSSETIAKLLKELNKLNIIPYYFFQMRPTAGNFSYAVPIKKGIEIINEAYASLPGLVKTARYVMSHKTGKIEIVGSYEDKVILKYHRAAKEEDANRILMFENKEDAYWLEDYL